MPEFSATSAGRLATCHPALVRLFGEAVKHFDCAILEGRRDKARQDQLFAEGKSRLKWPQGKHCAEPPAFSHAVDVAPYVMGRASYDQRHCLYFAGFVMGLANQMGIKIRWGGDWDSDNECVTDQDFQDLVHFELVEG
jgi:peptidoglycan LD-endopeptidase CwlK